jgi:chitinase
MKNIFKLVSITTFIFYVSPLHAQKAKKNNQITVIGYFAGRSTMLDSFPIEKLTHLIFCFTHLKGSQMSISNRNDTATLNKIAVLKKTKYPSLKTIVSLGGWTGCYTCSEVFMTDSSRKVFASSVKKILNDFSADGFDLDWEYPVIKGPPGHPYSLQDKNNLTALMKTLRDSLGKEKEISFAAGGFSSFIDESVNWKKVIKYVDRINLMTYDLITGYDTVTGHHTALYSNSLQKESTDNAVQMLRKKHVPSGKLVIGAAFYARIWENVPAINNGLYQQGKFRNGVSFRSFSKVFSTDSGFVYNWDPISKSPYYYNKDKKWFATFDDTASIRLKTVYTLKNHLNGIMFWQLADDSFINNGLLDIIADTKEKYK